MSRRDPLVRLKHMLDYAREAVEMAKGQMAKDLDKDRKLALSLTHLVELIGESASQVPQEVRGEVSQCSLAEDRQHAQQAYPWLRRCRLRHSLGYHY